MLSTSVKSVFFFIFISLIVCLTKEPTVVSKRRRFHVPSVVKLKRSCLSLCQSLFVLLLKGLWIGMLQCYSVTKAGLSFALFTVARPKPYSGLTFQRSIYWLSLNAHISFLRRSTMLSSLTLAQFPGLNFKSSSPSHFHCLCRCTAACRRACFLLSVKSFSHSSKTPKSG